MIGCRRERRVRADAHMARVADPPRTGRAGGFDRRRMASDSHLAELIDGDDKHLVRALG